MLPRMKIFPRTLRGASILFGLLAGCGREQTNIPGGRCESRALLLEEPGANNPTAKMLSDVTRH